MDLYVCSTYYHILITVIKCLKNKGVNDIAITHYIYDGKAICKKLEESNIFRCVYYWENNDYQPNGILEKLFWRKKVFISKVDQNLELNLNIYSNINIFMDYIWFAKYCKDKKIHYNIIEDAMDVFKYIYKSPYSFMVIKKKNLKNLIKRVLTIIFPYNYYSYEYYLDCKYIDNIEVNEKKDIYLKQSQKIHEVSRKDMFLELSDDEKKQILKIFSLNTDIVNNKNMAIIFTYAFVTDKVIKDDIEQFKLYQKLCSMYSKEYTVILKPHPRDNVDYSELKNAIVMKKEFPSELINFINNDNIKKYISIFSHCVDVYPKDKVVYYELDDIKNII